MSEDFDSDHESITNALLDLENSFMNELKKIRSVINGDCDISILGTNSEVSDINPELKTVKKIDSVFDESFSKLFHLREGLKKKITNKLKRKGFVVPSVSSSSTSDDDSLSTTEDSSSTLLSKASTNQRSSSSLASCRDFKIKIKPIEFDQNKLNTTNLSDLSASLSETPCTKRVRFQETDTDKLDNSAEAMESNSSIRRSSRIRILPKKLRRPSFEFDSDEEDIVEGSVNAQNNESVKTTVSSSSSTGISSSNEESESSNHVDDSQSKNQGDLNKGASEYSSNPGPSAPKRKRGRPKIIDDDDDDDSDDDYKKRRQRKHTSSDGNDSNSDEDSPSKAKRKNIRKVKSTKDLGDEAKNAAREEIERRKRIEERQKLYNQVIDEDIEKVKQLDKLVLDFDEKTKEELIVVNSTLVKNLKPHQANGIKFMWDACFESLQQINNGHPGSGCILAHCMGLGKTLQVITLTHTLFANTAKTKVNKVLVITPLSTVLNWANEFKTWLKDCKPNLHIFEMSKKTKNQDRVKVLKEWHDRGGVMLLGYDLFRILCNLTNGRMPKRQKEQLRESLIDPGPDLIVCDEGHLLKNEKTSLSKAVNQIRTRRRVVLTGTPLQNNLKEYYCMVQFVKPNLLGKYTEYLNRFVNPITNGQYTDSTPRDIQLMKKRSHVLHKLLDACVQRRDYGVLAPFLPKKHEYILYIKLTDLQATLYKYYMENKPNQLDPLLAKRSSVLFADFQNLQRIWTHPRVLRYNSDRYELVLQKRRLEDDEEESEGSINNFIDDSDSDETSSMASDRSVEPIKKRTRSTIRDSDSEMEIITTKDDNPTEWWMSMVDETELDNINHSGKLLLLMAILDKCEAIGDKLLVFSQSLYSLDVIEHFLNLIDNSTQENKADDKLAKHMGSWSPGVDYFRLDGSTSIQNRDQMCKLFNDKSNTRARLFLISTRAGGLGINLVAANRVIIFDASWNPSHDVQSIFRIYRFGQKKPCFVYRFVAMGTMEEKIYDRQVTKQAISKRVIDEQQIDRHYKENDLMELYSFNFDDPERPVPIFPKDRLFAEVLDEYPKILFKYHEHDSLLENKEEETLNEEERKAAWDEFEQEKSAPMVIASPYPTMMVRHPTHHNGPVTSNMSYGIRNDILLKLLNIKVRQDFPHLNDSQVGGLIPSYVQRLQAQMDVGNYELYCSILNLKMALENPALLGMPAGSGYSNAIREYMSQPMNVPMMPLPMAQNKMMNEQDRSRIGNPINTNLSSTEVIELD